MKNRGRVPAQHPGVDRLYRDRNRGEADRGWRSSTRDLPSSCFTPVEVLAASELGPFNARARFCASATFRSELRVVRGHRISERGEQSTSSARYRSRDDKPPRGRRWTRWPVTDWFICAMLQFCIIISLHAFGLEFTRNMLPRHAPFQPSRKPYLSPRLVLNMGRISITQKAEVVKQQAPHRYMGPGTQD